MADIAPIQGSILEVSSSQNIHIQNQQPFVSEPNMPESGPLHFVVLGLKLEFTEPSYLRKVYNVSSVKMPYGDNVTVTTKSSTHKSVNPKSSRIQFCAIQEAYPLLPQLALPLLLVGSSPTQGGFLKDRSSKAMKWRLKVKNEE